MLEARTFGKTPAALYLAEHLNDLDIPAVTRSTSRRLTGFRTAINELVASHLAGTMSAKTLAVLMAMMREGSFEKDNAVSHLCDELTENLITNVMIGEVKSVIRRLRQLHDLSRHQELLQADPDGYGQKFKHAVDRCDYWVVDGIEIAYRDEQCGLTIVPVSFQAMDDISPEELQVRSSKKLARQHKRNTLYPQP